jgi:LacI family transcriptional regulator
MARQAVVEHVRRGGPPDAILCRNDDIAFGVYRALCDLGLTVGEDVLWVGRDGIQETQFLPCPLSTIVLPVAQMCKLAWQFLDARLGDPAARRQEATLQGNLVIRESSARPCRHRGGRKPREHR